MPVRFQLKTNLTHTLHTIFTQNIWNWRNHGETSGTDYMIIYNQCVMTEKIPHKILSACTS